MAHDPTQWHAWDGTHHHGNNPNAFIPTFGPILGDYLAQYGPFGAPLSSLTEEHEGYVYLKDVAKPGGELYVNDIKNYPSPLWKAEDIMFRVHTTGDVHHGRKRFHSFMAWVTARNAAGLLGTAMLPLIADMGMLHVPYKKVFDRSTGNDPIGPAGELMPQAYIGNTPYRAMAQEMREGVASQIWSTTNLVANTAKWYPAQPNWNVGATWTSMDARELAINGQEEGTPTGFEHRRFQVFALMTRNLPLARPFDGVVDKNGHVVTGHVPDDLNYFQMRISANFPVGGEVWLTRFVRQNGDNPAVTVLQF